MKQEHKAMIKELADLLQENSLNEIEYAENGVHLRVVRHTPATNVAPVATPVAEPKKDIFKRFPIVLAISNTSARGKKRTDRIKEFIDFTNGRRGLFIPES